MRIYSFNSYLEYLRQVIDSHQTDRGYKTKLACAMHVHPSFITRVLEGTSLLTPDQAVLLAEFWGLLSAEKDYFFWLVMKARAADPAMQKASDEKLKILKDRFDELGSEIKADKIETTNHNTYFTHWVYPAVHMLATIPTSNSIPKIASRLGMAPSFVTSCAQALSSLGLLAIRGENLTVTNNNVHVSNRDMSSNQAHRNWRILALDRIGRPSAEDLRYSGIHTLSKKDLEKLKRMLNEYLLSVDKTVRDSKEETACVLNIDLFEL